MEERIFFQSEKFQLEGLFHRAPSKKGVVITHPHPLYGGDMENVVVAILADAYQKAGFSTFRFNFRGAGESEGRYSDGIGEAHDVEAAGKYLEKAGCSELHLAGYSFGSWVNASTHCDRSLFKQMVMVSPPVAFLEFDPDQPLEILRLVVTGRHDELAPPSRIRQIMPIWNPSAELEIIEGADHFFSGGFSRLGRVLGERLARNS